MNPEPGHSDRKPSDFFKKERAERDKQIKSAKKAAETFRKLKAKRKKK